MKRKNKYNGIKYYVVISLALILGFGSFVIAQDYNNELSDLRAIVEATNGDKEVALSVLDYLKGKGEQMLSAMSGPDNYGDYESLNGVVTYVKEVQFGDATTTPVSFLLPSSENGSEIYLTDIGIVLSGLPTSTSRMAVTTSTVAYDASEIEAALNDDAGGKIMKSIGNLHGADTAHPTSTVVWLNKYLGNGISQIPGILASGQYIHVVATSTDSNSSILSGVNTFAGKIIIKYQEIRLR